MKTVPYITPPGTYDLPFTWAFDASGFADGSNHPNSSIYLQGGYGDFQLRRIVGMNRILAADGTGKFQVQRASKGSYIQSDPVQAPNSPELAVTPEEPYLETGKIWFDLLGILKPAGKPLTAQVAFQGVRRMKGNPPSQPAYRNTPHSYTYQVSATLTTLASAQIPVVTKTLIVDYDFELHEIIILDQLAPSSCGGTPPIVTSIDVCSLLVYDQNKVTISNLPILDRFFNGAPASPYQNGALVPPLFFRKDSILEIDFYSQITNALDLPANVTVYLIGKKLYPCA